MDEKGSWRILEMGGSTFRFVVRWGKGCIVLYSRPYFLGYVDLADKGTGGNRSGTDLICGEIGHFGIVSLRSNIDVVLTCIRDFGFYIRDWNGSWLRSVRGGGRLLVIWVLL